jgi:hypothetical protein
MLVKLLFVVGVFAVLPTLSADVWVTDSENGRSIPQVADGDMNSRWGTGDRGKRGLKINFNASREIKSLDVHWHLNNERSLVQRASKYTVSVSNDGKMWNIVSTITGDSQKDAITLDTPVTAQYLKLDFVEIPPIGWVSIHEIKLNGKYINAVHRYSLLEPGVLKKRLLESGIEDIVFTQRGSGKDGHWYANIGYRFMGEKHGIYGTGASMLATLNVESGNVTPVMKDEKGGFRDPQVHYDGKKILFSYRKGGTGNYHLYEINTDGSGLKQLTDGVYDDIEATYMPNDKIMFVSTRSQRWVSCWFTQVATLYNMNADGTNIQMISPNIEHDNTPWPLPDGRILYTRWEYVDRSQMSYHHLWTTNPDGTNQTVYYGNMHPGNVFIDAKPIPGTNKVVCIKSHGHGHYEHGGDVAIVTDENGPDDRDALKTISRGFDGYSYRDPYPITEDLFIASFNDKIVVLDDKGNLEVLLEIKGKHRQLLQEPRPVMTRKRETKRPDMTDPTKETGQLILTNAYLGRNMDGIEPGSIKSLLVMETLPKPINHSGSMEPMSWGGTFTLERILGKVPVEDDGSAYFELPAKRPVFLIALDEKDQAVKRMQSFMTVMPGEVTSCIGCHEERTTAPIKANPSKLMAMQRPVSKLKPVEGVPELYDYPKHIQPILDKHCVSCHNADKRAGGVQLTGDHGPLFSQSYFWLSMLDQLGDNRNRSKSNYAPYKLGDVASKMMQKILNKHHDVELSESEIKMVRYWLHAGGPWLGSYAGLNTGMFGGDSHGHDIDRSDLRFESVQKSQLVMKKRCSSCHDTLVDKPYKGNRNHSGEKIVLS